ncbi:MAG: hypothetical protein VZQ80_09890, partial [Lachnospiraceae bacterium]|nr:hypothetical protein [Lachnospiraceae bacterium]
QEAAVSALRADTSIDNLWACIEAFAGYEFSTWRGLPFSYTVKGGEIFVDRKEDSKSLTRSSVAMSLEKAKELMADPGYVKGPKKLGAWGVSYIYPMFLEFGIIKKAPK